MCPNILLKVTKKGLSLKTLILFRLAVRQTSRCNFINMIDISLIYQLFGFVKRFRAAISPKLLPKTTPMKIELGTMSLWLGIIHAIDMALNSKELFLILVVPKEQIKSLETTLCWIVIEKCYINFNILNITSTRYKCFFLFQVATILHPFCLKSSMDSSTKL